VSEKGLELDAVEERDTDNPFVGLNVSGAQKLAALRYQT